MKKSFAILLIIMLLAAAGCQKTPAEPIVVEKNTEIMLEKAAEEEGGTPVKELKVNQEQFVYDSTNEKGNLTIHVDAQCYIPEVETLSVYEVKMQPFTQEVVTGVYDYVFGEERVLNNSERTMLKREIQTVILALTKRLADRDYADEAEKAQIEEDLAAMQEAFVLAPENSIKIERNLCDGKLKLAENEAAGQAYQYYELWGSSTDSDKILSVETYSEGRLEEEEVQYNFHNNLDYDASEIWYRKYEGSAEDADLSAKVGISYEEACDLCDEFLAGCGLEGIFAPSAAYVMSDGGTGLVDVDENNKDDAPGESFAYKILYARKIDGVNSYNGTGGISFDEKEYTVPWEYESLSFLVNENGVLFFDWAAPVAVGEVVQADCTLKSFDEIKEIFERMMDIVYTARLDHYQLDDAEMLIDVQKIELCMMRIRKQNAGMDEGLMVPAWVFYGYNEYVDSNGEKSYNLEGNGGSSLTKKDPIPLLAINAIDGSIIDTAKGY